MRRTPRALLRRAHAEGGPADPQAPERKLIQVDRGLRTREPADVDDHPSDPRGRRRSAKSWPPTWSRRCRRRPPGRLGHLLDEAVGLRVDDQIRAGISEAARLLAGGGRPITRPAPNAFASWIPSSPTEDVAPTIRTLSPAVNPAWVTSASCSVESPPAAPRRQSSRATREPRSRGGGRAARTAQMHRAWRP